jgi:hypothetical protein
MRNRLISGAILDEFTLMEKQHTVEARQQG